MRISAKVVLIALMLSAAVSIWPSLAGAGTFDNCWWDKEATISSPDNNAFVVYFECAEGWYGVACTKQRDTGEYACGVWIAD